MTTVNASVIISVNIVKPKLNEKFIWTLHCQEKMRFYGLSENRLKRVLRSPDRIEEGIAPKNRSFNAECR